ncbi:hypothetical protein DSC45_06385 [Streptomyces sp. YIM 130001]|uniref:DUF397 domain-containing protein n=1 Tax=Streptomyces sp. YIM 130001 TaxID=2259644 RepID=UPI000E659B66|nr:DUF397 domain-containing protein [Streptomyces sp. YIM 130001]RII19623.1 hypothetical protein DSC45_06385 [Streptomyces sp. YIM 130001]
MTDLAIPDASAFSGWRKSSYSNDTAGSCLEVLDTHPSGTPVRDSKNPAGPALLFTSPAWSAFVTAVAGDELS